MDVTVLDEADRPVVGQVGELAVRNTWPCMTHASWHDRERYLETYWSRWDGVWLHGDLASADMGGTWRIHGQAVTMDPDPGSAGELRHSRWTERDNGLGRTSRMLRDRIGRAEGSGTDSTRSLVQRWRALVVLV
jgi:hypothetical protein